MYLRNQVNFDGGSQIWSTANRGVGSLFPGIHTNVPEIITRVLREIPGILPIWPKIWLILGPNANQPQTRLRAKNLTISTQFSRENREEKRGCCREKGKENRRGARGKLCSAQATSALRACSFSRATTPCCKPTHYPQRWRQRASSPPRPIWPCRVRRVYRPSNRTITAQRGLSSFLILHDTAHWARARTGKILILHNTGHGTGAHWH